MTRFSPTRRWAALVLGVLLIGAGCGGSSLTTGAPVLTVVTGLWPLAAAASEIGQGNVAIDDVVPPGDDPRTTTLNAAETAEVHRAGLVLEIGGGFQPSFEAAAGGSHPGESDVVRVLRPGGASPYVWLNPFAMEQAGASIAGAMEKADPKAAPTFRTGLANYQAELGSLDADYQSTLSTCPDQVLVTVDDAFAGLHPRYPVIDRAIVDGAPTPTPSAAAVRQEVAAVKASGAKKIYTETWIPESDILGASAEAGVQVGTISTLEGPPTPVPWPFMAGKKYESLMEANLSTLSAALHCPNADEN